MNGIREKGMTMLSFFLPQINWIGHFIVSKSASSQTWFTSASETLYLTKLKPYSALCYFLSNAKPHSLFSLQIPSSLTRAAVSLLQKCRFLGISKQDCNHLFRTRAYLCKTIFPPFPKYCIHNNRKGAERSASFKL